MNRTKDIPGYLYGLDGLRAVSMLLIWMFHAFQQSWIFAVFPQNSAHHLINLTLLQQYGYIAIDAFFVLSGFCLFYPIARTMFEGTPFGGWKSFYYKRVKKIWPSYLFMLFALLIVPALSYGTNDLHGWNYWKHFVYHVFFIHNISPETIGSTISTAWTMAIEVQFYLVFPLFAWCMKKSPALTLLGGTVLSHTLRLYYATKGDTSAFVQGNPLLYFDIFLWGMVAAYAVVWARNRCPNMKNTGVQSAMTVASAAALGLLYQILRWMNEVSFGEITGAAAATVFRFLYRPLIAFLFAAFLFAVSNSLPFWEKKVWGNRFFIFLSTISYNFYLWHQNVHIFFKEVVPRGIPAGMSDVATASLKTRWIYLGVTLMCSLIIAVFTTYLIEQPFAKYGFRGYVRYWKERITKKAAK